MRKNRQLFFNPVSGQMRFDIAYPNYNNVPKAICWPCEQQRNGKEYGFKNLTLALTMKCNMACDYCWQRHNHIPDMDCGTIDTWVDFFIDENKNNPHKVLYYGGEPLMRLDLIEYASLKLRQVCEERGVTLPAQHIFTNGTLLSDKNVERLQEMGVFLIISIDGDESHDSAHRRTLDGSSAHKEILRNVKRLRDFGMKFGICCTISDPCFDAEETVGYLLDETHPYSFELNVRHDYSFRAIAECYEGHNLIDFENAWDLIESHGVMNIDLRKRICALADGVPLQNSSSGSKNKLSIMPNGMISTFNGAVSFPELQIEPSGSWINDFRHRWNRNVLVMPTCETCEAVFICGQGSAFSSYLQYGDFDHVPALHCEYCRTALRYIRKRVEERLSINTPPKGHVASSDEIRAAFPTLFGKNTTGA